MFASKNEIVKKIFCANITKHVNIERGNILTLLQNSLSWWRKTNDPFDPIAFLWVLLPTKEI